MLGRSIVAKASFWWERLDIKQFVPELSSNSEAQVSQRLERWCNVVAQGNWDKFQRRLQWDGLDIDQVRPCLGTVRLVAEQLPKWANTLAQVVEYVEHQACENEAAAQRFYQRAGMLLCWLYALRGIDCHYQNLIASGEHLVLVDLETLLDPEVKLIDNSLDAQEMESTAGQQFYDSVLRTGLLP